MAPGDLGSQSPLVAGEYASPGWGETLPVVPGPRLLDEEPVILDKSGLAVMGRCWPVVVPGGFQELG